MSGIWVMEGRESLVVSGGLVQLGMGQQFMGVDHIVYVINGTLYSLKGQDCAERLPNHVVFFMAVESELQNDCVISRFVV
jgi:hypothetical protein